MATKKDKILENAQKFIAKGQIDRAIKEYEQLVGLDPKDVRSRQRLAELLVRVNRREEAINEYETIGKFYSESAFHLKAIAVYKQIQKLDPGNIDVSLNLASLNEKQGLTGNALAEYDLVCSHYLKQEQYAEALKIIERMLAADPENLNTRLKLAETEFAAGNAEKSYSDFMKLLMTLQKRDDGSAFNHIADRVKALFPGQGEFVLDLLVAEVKEGHAAAVMPRLREYLGQNQNSLKAWNLLVDTQAELGEILAAKATLQQMVSLFPEEIPVKERLVQAAFASNDADGTLAALGAYLKEFLASGRLPFLEKIYTELLVTMPVDLRVLEGLKTVYESGGDNQKLNIILEKIASISRTSNTGSVPTGLPESSEQPEEVVPRKVEASVPEDGEELGEEPLDSVTSSDEGAVLAAVEAAAMPEVEEEWEEELDLNFLDEEPEVSAAGDNVSQHSAPVESAPELPAVDAFLPLDDSSSEELDSIDETLPLDDLELAEELEPETLEELDLEALEELEPELELSAGTQLQTEPERPQEIGQYQLEQPEDGGELAPTLTFDDADLESFDLGSPSSSSSSAVDLGELSDDTDLETHYNLGIAYKEMGLYDEAITELRIAARSPQYQFSCLTLEGICYRDKGEILTAEAVYKRGIAQSGLTVDEKASLMYELAFLYESCGRTEEAIKQYSEIRTLDPDFRDVAIKVAKLEGEESDHYDIDLEVLDLEES